MQEAGDVLRLCVAGKAGMSSEAPCFASHWGLLKPPGSGGPHLGKSEERFPALRVFRLLRPGQALPCVYAVLLRGQAGHVDPLWTLGDEGKLPHRKGIVCPVPPHFPVLHIFHKARAWGPKQKWGLKLWFFACVASGQPVALDSGKEELRVNRGARGALLSIPQPGLWTAVAPQQAAARVVPVVAAGPLGSRA